MMHFNAVPVVNTILCAVFCGIYLVALLVSNLYFVHDKFKGKLDVKEATIKGGLFGIFMSLPFMPFVYGFSVVNEFSINVITLFFFSNIIWQTLFLRYKFNQGLENFFVAVSASNLIAWAFMAVANHLFYFKLGEKIAALF
ncbi:hypothetical protein A3F66_01075 [candidate division TM6 bacterium RIFCSPHIGHO2_12_FULL_32_22]|nr:MAG: hypothetical protein A3F66_01075 [candidate division TM6 bacterium RIFCSPHIGHO2_12_FULL_32_22]